MLLCKHGPKSDTVNDMVVTAAVVVGVVVDILRILMFARLVR